MKMIIFTHGCDSPGIGEIITKTLLEKDLKTLDFKIIAANGFFSLIIVIETDRYFDKSEIEEALKTALKEFKVKVKVCEESLPSVCIKRQKDDWIPYKINIICSNQTEALYYFMKEANNFNINISSINCKNTCDSSDDNHQITTEIQVPTYVSIEVLKSTLKDLSISLNIVIDINSVENLDFEI